MKNLKDICKEIAAKIKAEMEDAIEFNYDHIYKDFIFGKAWVQVELELNSVHGWVIPTTEVTVFHDDNSHQSPLLEAAIKNALPTWDEVEREYNSTSERSFYLF